MRDTDNQLQDFLLWRDNLRWYLEHGGDMMAIMHLVNHLAVVRQSLAPEQWAWCPSCGGRGMWTGHGDGNWWCRTCGGPRIILVEEIREPVPAAVQHTGIRTWRSKL
jgi:hypothetical protein